MNINDVANELRKVFELKRDELSLKFFEDTHIYHMIDSNGKICDNYPSVTKVIKKFYDEFDAEQISEQISKGDRKKKNELLLKWKESGDKAVNLGNRVHYFLEQTSVDLFNLRKTLREPVFECDRYQLLASDKMISAGNKYLKIMKERGGVLLDTEMVIGHPDLGYVGQPDKVWLFESKSGGEIGIAITDWKTNQSKNFVPNKYTKKLKPPFDDIDDTALGHYYLQLPLYGKLLLKMLEGTEFENTKLLGCIVVHLNEDSMYSEYRVPQNITNRVLQYDFKLHKI